MLMRNKTASNILMAMLLVGFIWISVGVHFNAEWLIRLDEFGNQLFRLNLSEAVNQAIFNFTHIGSIRYLVVVAVGLGGLLLLFKKELTFWWFGLTVGLVAGVVPWFLKQFFARARPIDGLMVRFGYSFPSGHAIGVLALYGLVIFLAHTYMKKNWSRHLIMLASLAIILIVSWSRIHLGVHFLSDILASFSLGMFLLMTAQRVLVVYLQPMNEKSECMQKKRGLTTMVGR